jgi:predicted DCC family thiol-disulfide oxidoreductase YuxK
MYRLVARLRYALFGEYRGKPLAESEWSGRFL